MLCGLLQFLPSLALHTWQDDLQIAPLPPSPIPLCSSRSALLEVDPAQLTVTEMALRLNSLSFVRQQLPEVLDEVRERWRPYGTVPNGVDRMAFITRLLDVSATAPHTVHCLSFF